MSNDLPAQLEQIADGLAENGYAVIDQFLTEPEMVDILETDEFRSWKLHFKKAGVGRQQARQVVETIRGDYIQWIDPASANPAIGRYFEKLRSLMQFVNRSLYLSLKDFEIHMTIYPVGTFYKRHLDQFKSDEHRKLSVICYLNQAWKHTDGGQLRMYLPVGPVDVFPVAGRLVCFRSDQIEHEVLPATRERLSLTGWMLDQEII
jgi:SM-20-related protein